MLEIYSPMFAQQHKSYCDYVAYNSGSKTEGRRSGYAQILESGLDMTAAERDSA